MLTNCCPWEDCTASDHEATWTSAKRASTTPDRQWH